MRLMEFPPGDADQVIEPPRRFSLLVLLYAVALAAIGVEWIYLVLSGQGQTGLVLLYAYCVALSVAIGLWRRSRLSRRIAAAYWSFALGAVVACCLTAIVHLALVAPDPDEYAKLDRAIWIAIWIIASPIGILAAIGLLREWRWSRSDREFPPAD